MTSPSTLVAKLPQTLYANCEKQRWQKQTDGTQRACLIIHRLYASTVEVQCSVRAPRSACWILMKSTDSCGITQDWRKGNKLPKNGGAAQWRSTTLWQDSQKPSQTLPTGTMSGNIYLEHGL